MPVDTSIPRDDLPAAAPVAVAHRPATGRAARLAVAALLLALFALPFLVPAHLLTLTQRILILALLATSTDLLYGHTGLPSLGQGAYFGVGGYAAGQLMTKAGVDSFWVVFPAAIGAGAIVAAVFGLVALRTRGSSFLLVTFALGELLATAATRLPWLQTPGVRGLTGITMPELFPGQQWTLVSRYYFVVTVAATAYLVLRAFTNSHFGLVLRGIRHGASRMTMMGHHVWLGRYAVFVLAGAVGALAGQLQAFTSGVALPSDLGIATSGLALLIVSIGGPGRLSGNLAGAALVLAAQHYASALVPARWPLLLGAMFCAAAFLRGGGIVGLSQSIGGKVVTRWRATPQP